MNWIDSIVLYHPYNAQEGKDKELALKYMGIYEDLLTRHNELIHITCSSFVLNKAHDKVLMAHHNIYNSWAWLGGHADGEKDMLQAAERETREEAGIKHLHILSESAFSLDIIPVRGHTRRGEYISPHLHISLTYLFEADENEELIVKPDENSGVRWIPISEIDSFSSEPHMIEIYNKLLLKIKAHNY